MSDHILILGSFIYDSISTPFGSRQRILGGSANYATLATAFYQKPISVVGSIGRDYQESDLEKLMVRGVDTSHIYVVEDQTAHWEGHYDETLNEAKTLNEADFIRVFSKHCEDLRLSLQSASFQSSYVLLGNTAPDLQMAVLNQVAKQPLVVGYDTRDAWIHQRQQRDKIKEILKRVDILFVNEEECRLLAQTQNTLDATLKLQALGPRAIIIKRGEYGFLLAYQGQILSLPAFPLKKVVDTTGAGDVFAGAVMGFLMQSAPHLNKKLLGEACLHGTVVASFVVEGFGLLPLENITFDDIESRFNQYKDIISI